MASPSPEVEMARVKPVDPTVDLRLSEGLIDLTSTYKVRPLKGNFIKSIDHIRDVFFTAAEIDLFLTMTAGLDARIRERMEQVRTESVSPP
jgi:hypothetical protein